jgi:hypothetical protein
MLKIATVLGLNHVSFYFKTVKAITEWEFKSRLVKAPKLHTHATYIAYEICVSDGMIFIIMAINMAGSSKLMNIVLPI